MKILKDEGVKLKFPVEWRRKQHNQRRFEVVWRRAIEDRRRAIEDRRRAREDHRRSIKDRRWEKKENCQCFRREKRNVMRWQTMVKQAIGRQHQPIKQSVLKARPETFRASAEDAQTPSANSAEAPLTSAIRSFEERNMRDEIEQEVKEMLAVAVDDNELLEREAAETAWALQLSKAEHLKEELVLARLVKRARSPQAVAALHEGCLLESCRRRLADADCELRQVWDKGPWQLTPLGELELFALLEASQDLQLRDCHVLLRSRDVPLLLQALDGITNVHVTSGLERLRSEKPGSVVSDDTRPSTMATVDAKSWIDLKELRDLRPSQKAEVMAIATAGYVSGAARDGVVSNVMPPNFVANVGLACAGPADCAAEPAEGAAAGLPFVVAKPEATVAREIGEVPAASDGAKPGSSSEPCRELPMQDFIIERTFVVVQEPEYDVATPRATRSAPT